MVQPSPTIEGFRAAFRRPGIVLAEVIWRWAFGAATLALLALSFLEFLDTLPVSKEDLFFLRTHHPFLVSHAMGHILHGSAQRFVYSLFIVIMAAALFWILAATLGRAATVKSLLEYFGIDIAENSSRSAFSGFLRRNRESCQVRSMLGLNFLRVALALASVLALFAAGTIAGFASSDADPHPGLVFLIFMPLALLVMLLWGSLNWFLSVAPIFAINERRDALGSVSAAVEFCRTRAGSVFWSSTAFSLLHLVAFVVATSVVVFPLAFADVAPAGLVIGAIVVLTLIYFAVVDFLYTGRMAAYICILQRPDATPAGVVPAALPALPHAPALIAPPEAGRWYRTEDDILSDVSEPPNGEEHGS